MNAVIDALNRAAATWWPYVLHATWQSALVAVVLLALVRLGRRWPAHVRYALLLIALVKFAIPPTLPLPTGLFSRLGPTIALDAGAGVEGATDDETDDGAAAHAGWTAFVRPLGRLSWRGWLLLVHAAGAAVLAACLAAQLAKVGALARRARLCRRGSLRDRADRLARQIGLRRRVRLLVSPDPVTPMAFGVVHPTVLVPGSLVHDVPRSQMETILAHELAHHRRGDIWANWFQALLSLVWWFNPVFWVLNTVVSRTREDCCDDLLLSRHFTTDNAYCEALLKVAGELRRRLVPEPASGFAHRMHPLGERIRRIMDPRLHRGSKLSFAAVALLVLVGGLLLPGLHSGGLSADGRGSALADRDAPADEDADAAARTLAAAPAEAARAQAAVAWTPASVWTAALTSPQAAPQNADPHGAEARAWATGVLGRPAGWQIASSAGPARPPEGSPGRGPGGADATRRSDGHLLDVYGNMDPVLRDLHVPTGFGLGDSIFRTLFEPIILRQAEPLQGGGSDTRLAQAGHETIQPDSAGTEPEDDPGAAPVPRTVYKSERTAPSWIAMDPAAPAPLVLEDVLTPQAQTITDYGAMKSDGSLIAQVSDGLDGWPDDWTDWDDWAEWYDLYGDYDDGGYSGGVSLTPEPGTLLLFAAGAVALLRRRRRSG